MPEVLRIGNVRFVIYYHDHWPPHVHVYKDNAEAKFEIYTGKCMGVRGFPNKALHEISWVIIENRDTFIEAWEKYEKEKR